LIEVMGRKILIQTPKDEAHITFLRNIRYSRWYNKIFRCEVPNYPGNLDIITKYFENRIIEIIVHESSKTTEIYTHITTKGFDQFKSPLGNLDI